MGVSWYVSYLYSKTRNPNHANWRQASTSQPRHAVFANITNHVPYLEYVMSGSPFRYNRNEIGLSGYAIIRMAREILYQIRGSSNSNGTPECSFKDSSCLIATSQQADNGTRYPDIIYQINNALEQGCTGEQYVPLISLDDTARDFFIIRMGQMKFNAKGWERFGRFVKQSDRERRLSIIWRTCKEMGILNVK